MNVLTKIEPQGHGLAVLKEGVEASILMLSPITPHICHQLWLSLGHEKPVLETSWPKFDNSALVKDTLQVVVQVNGKVRAKLEVASSTDKDALEAIALKDDNVSRHIEGKTIRKVIVVPNKLVNIVAN